MDEVERVLRELLDAEGLSQLGNTHYYGADFERASRVMREVADLYRDTGTPEGLVRAARALFNFGIALDSWGRPQHEIEVAYSGAAAAGREAATPEGLAEIAGALSNLGNALVSWGRPEQEIESTYRDAAAAGRESAIPKGLAERARALSNLGIVFARWRRETERGRDRVPRCSGSGTRGSHTGGVDRNRDGAVGPRAGSCALGARARGSGGRVP